uniref:Putative secreted peptide n=1 Tax=Anopheles braziliensis TaxID=58242 RepID=A0A2M3ZVU8_9DIPT
MVLPVPNGPPRCLLVAVVVPVAVAAARKHLTAEQISPHQRHPAAAVPEPEDRVCIPDGGSRGVFRPSSGSRRAALLFR